MKIPRALFISIATIVSGFIFASASFSAQVLPPSTNSDGTPATFGPTSTSSTTLTVPDGTDISATGGVSITNSVNGAGTLTLQGNSVISGTVGSSTAYLGTININSTNVPGAYVEFDDTVYIYNINIMGDNTDGVVFMNGVYGTAINHIDNTDDFGTALEIAGGTVTPTIIPDSDDRGVIYLGGTSATIINGQIGAPLKKIDYLIFYPGFPVTFNNNVYTYTFDSSGIENVILNGDLYASSCDVYGATVITVANGKNINAPIYDYDHNCTVTYAGASSTGGNVGGSSGTRLGAVNVNGGIVTLNNNIFANTTTINSGGTLKLSGNQSITGAVNLAGTGVLDLATNTLTHTGIYTQPLGTTLKLAAGSSTSFGKIVSTGNAVVDDLSKVNVAVTGYIPNNTAFKIIDGGGGAGVEVPTTITSTSAVITFAGSVAAGDLTITATRASTYSSFSSDPNASQVGSVLNAIGTSGTATGDMLTVLNAIDSLPSGSQVGDALNSLVPSVDNSSPQVSQATAGQFISTVLAHLDGFKNVTATTAPAASPAGSDFFKDIDVWIGEFGNYLHQDKRDSFNGYNATIWGTVIGFDLPAVPNLRMGMSGGFAQDFVRYKDNSARTDIDSYQGTLYGSYAKDPYYIDAAFSFAYNVYNNERQIAFGTISRTATGDYGGEQCSAYLGGGYIFNLKKLELTPIASFQYTYLRLNGYTEDGAGALNLKVDSQDYSVAQTGLGAKVAYPLNFNNKFGKLTPEVRFKWLYDWVGDTQQATSTFTGGGGSFTTQGFKPAQSSYDIGTKLTLETKSRVTISLNYDLELKDGFYGHYGYANLRYRF